MNTVTKIKCIRCEGECEKKDYMNNFISCKDLLCPLCDKRLPFMFLKKEFTKEEKNDIKEYLNNNDNKLLNDMKEAMNIHGIDMMFKHNKYSDEINEYYKKVENYNNLKIENNNTKKLIKEIKNKKYELYNEPRTEENKKERVKRFLQPCRNDSCKGYLNSNWRCEMCENYTCRNCFDVIGLELPSKENDVIHECDPNEVETAKLIKQDTKPCPQCHTLIYKISGCDQMWCTVCHLTFSWKTGLREKNIHNPHYYEWLRNKKRQPINMENIICDNQILTNNHILLITQAQNTRKHLNSSQINELERLMMRMIHNNEVDFPRFDRDYFGRNKEYRIKYLVNEMDEDTFKLNIQRSEKRNLKDTEIMETLNLFSSVFLDLINKFIEKKDDENYECKIFEEIEEIRNYCNDLLKQIGNKYKNLPYEINNQLYLYRMSSDEVINI